MRPLAFVTALLLALLAGAAAADMEVYQPRHRTGEDLAPLARAAMEGEGSVAVDGHTGALVLLGPPEAIAQALALLASQDRRLRTVLVRSETRTQDELAATGYRVAWSVGGSRVRVGNVERAEPGAAVVLGERHGAGEGLHGSVVRVLEGEWGRIAQGSEVLVPIGSERNPGTAVLAAESGLEVRPRILGDGRVRLDLRPFRARLDAGGIRREGAETTVVVEPGRTAVVGGIGQAGEASGSALAGGAGHASGARDSLLLVTVTLEDEGQDAP